VTTVRASCACAHLLLPDVTKREHALGAQDLGGAELAELAPVVAGGGEEDVDPLIADDLAGEELGACGEVGVVRPPGPAAPGAAARSRGGACCR
jgi:hypothetical protein